MQQSGAPVPRRVRVVLRAFAGGQGERPETLQLPDGTGDTAAELVQKVKTIGDQAENIVGFTLTGIHKDCR